MHHDVILLNRGFKDINPLLCGYESCSEGYAFGPARREYFLLHYIVSGKGIFKTKNVTYSLSQGNIFIIRPNEITYYKADDDDPWTYIWIGFEYNLYEGSALNTDFFNKDILYSKACEYIFTSMLQAENLNASREIYLCSKLYELFSILMEADNQSEVYNSPALYVMKAKNYIATNYVNNITVEGISRFLGIDRRYFCSIFKKHTGKSPKQYIVDLRLEKAAALLIDYGYTPGEAAASTGYSDIFNFSKMFKRKYSMSPLNYKNEKLLNS